MIQAIKALIHNPQNNLRIFKNGLLYYSEENKIDFNVLLYEFFQFYDTSSENLLDEFCLIICKSLLFNENSKSEECKRKLFCKWNKIIQNHSNYNNLPEGCVLEKILSVQMLDVEGSNYYFNLLKEKKKIHDFGYVKKLLDISKDNDCLKCSLMMVGIERNDLELLVAPYLISAIAQDCSLMLTFQKSFT